MDRLSTSSLICLLLIHFQIDRRPLTGRNKKTQSHTTIMNRASSLSVYGINVASFSLIIQLNVRMSSLLWKYLSERWPLAFADWKDPMRNASSQVWLLIAFWSSILRQLLWWSRIRRSLTAYNRQVSRMLQLRSGKSCAFANKSLRPERSFAFSAWTSTASPEYVCKQTQDVYTCGSAAS